MNAVSVECAVALGSNLGDRAAHLRAAAAFLESLATGPVEFSPVFEAAPLDCPPGSPAFLNAAAIFPTTFEPGALLARCRAFESARGRPGAYARNSPRPLDLDLLYHGGLVSSDPGLILPHPRLHLRRFVLEPLAALRPDLVLPGFDRTISELLAGLPSGDKLVRVQDHP